MTTKFARYLLDSPHRVAMPIGIYAGLEITGASVQAAVSDPQVQADAILALHKQFDTIALLTAMDLSAEAEAFGCTVRMDDEEIPTVLGRRATSPAEIDALAVPEIGAARTSVHLQTVRNLANRAGGVPILGGVIGPFSLAGRIFGVSEALEMSLSNPEALEALVTKAAAFLAAYVGAFRDAGAAGVIMAEPTAGLLSPRGMGRFSSPYIRQIIEATRTDDFTLLYHNCGAKIVHLPKILETDAEVFHFGEPMDIVSALPKVDSNIILGGNLDPTSVFYSGTPGDVRALTRNLLDQTREYRNYFISSGCDLPPHTPIENLEAFYAEVHR